MDKIVQSPLFIVGNSRSGTTMMMRVFDKHSSIHAINEPHFYETYWSPADDKKCISKAEAEKLLRKLLTRQREGYFEKPKSGSYQDEINDWIGKLPSDKLQSLCIYDRFIHEETRANGKEIPCEKTPQNIFYIKEILAHFPNALIIVMMRDPRSVLLSQKKKWKRKFLGGSFITTREVLRLLINYHPITMSRLWNSAAKAGERYQDHPQVHFVRFEDLVQNADEVLNNLCEHIGINYEENMQKIPVSSSSSEADSKNQLGINTRSVDRWKKGLSSSEIYLCQKLCAQNMAKWSYEPVKVLANPLRLLYSILSFPVKICLALIVNLGRMRSIIDSLKRRLKPSN